MKKRISLIGLLLMMLIISACTLDSATEEEKENSNDANEGTSGSGEYVIGVTYTTPESGATHIGMEKFKELLEEETGGDAVVELYPNGQLYSSEREAVEAAQAGNVEMTVAASAPVAGFDERFLALDLPFIFPDHDTAYEALDGELGQTLLDGLTDIGLVGLGYGETGMRQFSNDKKPIEEPSDMEGLKIRSMENEVQIDTFEELGANASPFAFGELYSALQQNTYDGMDNPINLIDQMKFYEVQDYLTLSNHSYTATVAFMNEDFFNDLPEDIQEAVEDTLLESMEYQREEARKQDEEGMEVIEENMEITELDDDQRQEFIDAVEPIYEKYEDAIGSELMEMARSYMNED